jgi:hypothetical protein
MLIENSPQLAHVTVCDTGVFWGNTAEHQVFYRKGVNDDTPMGTGWKEVTSDLHNLRQVSCGKRGHVVGRNSENQLVLR